MDLNPRALTSGDFTDMAAVVMLFPTVTLALWLKCTLRFFQCMFEAHCLIFAFLYLRGTFSQTAAESASCVCCKVATWCKALTSSLSRRQRSMRCRKQSSACLCSTSSDMAWPLHRSPFYTMGFLLECRVCMDSVCSLCLKICLN